VLLADLEKIVAPANRHSNSPPALTNPKRSAQAGKLPYQMVARTGYLARGLVYAIVGLVALSVAAGVRRTPLTLTECLHELLGRPLGLVVVTSVAVGMACFALWRMAQGILDADNLGNAPRAWLRRLGYALSSLAYLGVAAVTTEIVFRMPSSTSTSSSKGWAAWLLGWPLGSVALGLIGAGFLGFGAATGIKAYRAPFEKEFDLKSSAAKWLVPIGRAGHAARALIFLLVGYFLVMSAYYSDVHQVKDMAGALNVLQHQPFGMIIYTAVAAGLTCFGVFEFIQALFRKVGALS
jgi:hypothetical protein